MMSNVREKILFDENWIFHPGDVDDRIPVDKGPIYTQSKTETMLWGPAAISVTPIRNLRESVLFPREPRCWRQFAWNTKIEDQRRL